jgi:hypothetical protein
MPYALTNPNPNEVIPVSFFLLYACWKANTHTIYLDLICDYSKLYLFVVHHFDE